METVKKFAVAALATSAALIAASYGLKALKMGQALGIKQGAILGTASALVTMIASKIMDSEKKKIATDQAPPVDSSGDTPTA